MHVSLWNVALQTVSFVILAWLLQRFLFKPVRAVLAKRQEAIDASLGEAAAKKAEAERTIEEYRAKTAGIAGEAERAREAALGAAEKEARQLREEAARQAQVEIERAKGEVQRERADALHELEGRAADLAASIARRLLAEVSADGDASFLWRLLASIDGLDAARKAAFGRQLASENVEVVSSRALDAPTRARLEVWMASLAGKPVTPSYGVDGSLIAGVELRLSTGVWRSHWRASLDRIRAELEAHAAAA
jgi:F-type H+-transporting ATPase subunit b